MFKTIMNAIKTPDVRKRLLYTLLLIVVFRFGCFITVPGVDTIALNDAMSNTNGIAGLIDMISGGAFSRFSVFAMSISPYITASIVIQLLAMIIPSLERLTKEGGEEGRKKINRYTKLLTIVLALVEGIGIYLSYKSSGIFVDNSFLTGALVVTRISCRYINTYVARRTNNKQRNRKWNIITNIYRYYFRTSKRNNNNLEPNYA